MTRPARLLTAAGLTALLALPGGQPPPAPGLPVPVSPPALAGEGANLTDRDLLPGQVTLSPPARARQPHPASRSAPRASRGTPRPPISDISRSKTTAGVTPTTGDPTSAQWAQLRQCESGGDYQSNTGNGYYGAYQGDVQTWDGYAGYARPDLAPPDVQDAWALQLWRDRGWAPWPACSAKLGLR